MKYLENTLSFVAETDDDRKIVEPWDRDTDLFLFSGDISPGLDRTFRNVVEEKQSSTNVWMALTTYGGDPDAAYRIARFLRCRYEKFTLVVAGDCKSAGTLLALGAHEIVMTDHGELGPLDVQVFRPDEFMQRSSGLAISQAMSSLSRQAFETWEDMFLSIRRKSAGVITTKTASDIAKDIAIGLFAPITEKIDPSRVGEMQRSMEIAIQYGRRLGADEDLVHHLASGYPSHSFVIDLDEAESLFPSARAPNDFERIILANVADTFKDAHGVNPLRDPVEKGLLLKIIVEFQNKENQSHEGNGQPEEASIDTSKEDKSRATSSRKKAREVGSSPTKADGN